ncbi:hypothetical protein [Pseudomonas juntendi]|uniref:hypothetical protein n=1 Tax=Pseudomonas juntendi TaxID=2666183 RepID=UPI0030D360CA
MADQTQRLEIATVRAEVGSNILFRFANDAANADSIPTQSGDIQNLKQVVLEIQQDAAEKISISTTIYPSVAAGLAATADQGIFLVQSNDADEIYTVWQNQGGTAVNTGKTALSATAIQTALDASNEAARAAENAADVAITRTARYLAPSATPPVLRDDGLPLEIGDIWFNTVDQTEYRYTNDGWQANDSLVAIAELSDSIHNQVDQDQGASQLGFDGGTIGDILEHSQVVYDYPELRSYAGRAKKIYVTKAGIEGPFRSRGKVTGFIDTNGTYIIANDGTVWERVYSGPVSVLWFDCPLDGITSCDAAFASWAATLKTGSGLIPPIKYNLSSLKLNLVGHSPVIGGLEIDASGATIVGECAITLDSCKRVRFIGLDAVKTDFVLNGTWFFNPLDCKYRFLVLGKNAGSVFSDSYWNKIVGGQIQGVITHENAVGPCNKFTWDSVCFRGNAQQGFATDQEYALKFIGKVNCQSWVFKDCDMSYYTSKIIYVDPAVNNDIELYFDTPYFDTLFPSIPTRPKTRLVIENAHAANEIPNSATISQVARGSQDAWRSDRAAGWKSFTCHNLIPNGDFHDTLPSYVGTGLPIGSVNSAIVTPRTGGGINGNYININQALTSSNSVRFRPKNLPITSRYTSVMVIRNADAGSKKLRIGVAGLFFYATVNSSEWTMVNMTTGEDLLAGTTTGDTQIFTDDGTAFNIDVCYAGTFVGESVPLFLPAPRHPALDATMPWNPPSVPAGGQATQDITVVGAVLGDFARASFSLPLQGMTLSASVTAPDVVQVLIRNGTTSAIDLASSVLRVRVDKAGY